MSKQQPEALRLTEIARYCFRSEGMSDPPEQFESPTGDMVDYFDHVEIEKELLARIAELESQLAQRFDAADMATASAQGFRDGVASLSANAGEPRNAIERDALIDAIAQGLHGTWHCTRAWEAWHVGTMSQDDFEPVDESETPTEIADAVLALLAAPPAAQAEGWRLVPLEPTDEMLNATYAGQHCSDVYRDMLAASPTPPAEQQAASSAVLKAVREANMQLVRTGDGAFMLVPYKVATAEQAAPKAAPGEPTQEMIASVMSLVDLETSDPEDHRYDDGSKLAAQICRAVLALAPRQEAQEPVAWESTTPGYIKYITQARYEKFSPAVRRWYKPYRCSGCAERGAGFDACDIATAAAQGFRDGQSTTKQEE